MHVQYSICVAVLASQYKTIVTKTGPSEILELAAPCTIAQFYGATLQQADFNCLTIMMISIMFGPLRSHCVIVVFQWNEKKSHFRNKTVFNKLYIQSG